jgi:serine phosphatase RsbU (regulator of sigma subunit)
MLFLLFCFVAQPTFAQVLQPEVRFINYPGNLTEYEGAGAIVQDTFGVTYVGFSYGILIFDGRRQDFIHTESAVLHLALQSNLNRVYVACEKGFGFIRRNSLGEPVFVSVSKNLELAKPLSSQFAYISPEKEVVHFYYIDQLFSFDTDDNQTKITKLADDIQGCAAIGSSTYLLSNKTGMQKVDNDAGFTAVGDNKQLNIHSILFSFPFDAKQSIIGTIDGSLFLTDGKQHRLFAPQLGRLALKGGARMGDRILLATGQQGCLIVDLNGKLIYTLNATYGLPENEINAVFVDKQLRVWLAHNQVVSWSYLNINLFRVNELLPGNIKSIYYGEQLYLATDNGLFYFARYSSTGVINEDELLKVLERSKSTVQSNIELAGQKASEQAQIAQQQMAEAQTKSEKARTLSEEAAKLPDAKPIPDQSNNKLLSFFKSKKSKKATAEAQAQNAQIAQQRAQAESAQEEAQLAQSLADAQSEMAQQAAQEAASKEQAANEIQRDISSIYQQLANIKKQQITSPKVDFFRIGNTASEKFNVVMGFGKFTLAGSQSGVYWIQGVNAVPIVQRPCRLLSASTKYPNRVYVVAMGKGLGCLENNGSGWIYTHFANVSDIVYTVAEAADGALWAGTQNGALLIQVGAKPTDKPAVQRLSPDQKVTELVDVYAINGTPIVVQGGKPFSYINQRFVQQPQMNSCFAGTKRVMLQQTKNTTLALSNQQYYTFSGTGNQLKISDSTNVLRLLSWANCVFFDGKHLWIGSQNRLYKVENFAASIPKMPKNFKSFIRSIRVASGPKIEDFSSFQLEYKDRHYIQLEFSAPNYDNASQLRYQYRLDSKDAWQDIDQDKLNLQFSYGSYNFQVRAIDALGNISSISESNFTIAAPFWKNPLFILLSGLLAIVGAVAFHRWRQARLEQKNRILTKAVEDRTREIRMQNVKLEQAYEELNSTLDQVKIQKEEIEEKNLKIEDSIHYAKRIQTAILPTPELIIQALPKHFIFYRPRDIVSGDFYWMAELDHMVFIAAVDCTGHGVPGAFMSVVGYNILNQIVNEMRVMEPDSILFELDRRIRQALNQHDKSDSKDGMDISLAAYNKKEKVVKFAGANNPLYHLRKGEVMIYKGDKYPIGGNQYEDKFFHCESITVQKGDRLYLFSDGIIDQFGGPQRRKYTPKRLIDFITAHQKNGIQQQEKLFEQEFQAWMEGYSQLDDVMLIGFEI